MVKDFFEVFRVKRPPKKGHFSSQLNQLACGIDIQPDIGQSDVEVTEELKQIFSLVHWNRQQYPRNDSYRSCPGLVSYRQIIFNPVKQARIKEQVIVSLTFIGYLKADFFAKFSKDRLHVAKYLLIIRSWIHHFSPFDILEIFCLNVFASQKVMVPHNKKGANPFKDWPLHDANMSV